MSIQVLLTTTVVFLNQYIIPLIIAVAFLVFLWNAYLYFVQKSAEPEGRERAKQHALWSVAAFLLMIMFWGIINIAVSGLGIDRNHGVCPDVPGFPCFGSPGGFGGPTGEYECTELLFGLNWCSRSETQIQGFGD